MCYNKSIKEREVIQMLDKNKEKQKRKDRATWTPYYERVTKNKKAYNRKEKHRGKSWD